MAIKALQSRGAGGTRLTFNISIQQISDFRTQLVLRNGIVLDIVSTNGLCSNFVGSYGAILDEVARYKSSCKIGGSKCAQCQVGRSQRVRRQFVAGNSSIDDVFVGNGVVRDFIASYGAICNFGRCYGIVRDFIYGYRKGGDFLVSYCAILDILCVDDSVSAHTECDFYPSYNVAVQDARFGRNGRNQNIAVAYIDLSVSAYIQWVPRLLHLESACSIHYVERGVGGWIN